MKYKKGSNVFLVLPILMPLIIAIFIIGTIIIYSGVYIPNDTLDTLWKISLPDNIELIYEESTDPGFHGDRSALRIYKSDNIWSFINLEYGDSKEVESGVNDIIADIGIGSEYAPDFDKPYSWAIKKDGMDTLYIIQFLDDKRIYLAELIM
ncbi:MAG: hypothetical protein WC900_02700 [Oscillospiraceae bacterium]|jgi:hypothetical protein